MLPNDTGFNTTTTTRRISITSAGDVSLGNSIFNALAAGRGTLDLSKFITMLDGDGVTVIDGELAATSYSDYAGGRPAPSVGGCVGTNKSFKYDVRGPTFSATVKYTKWQVGRTVESIEIKPVPGNNPQKYIVVSDRQLRREQADAVLSKCDTIKAAGIEKMERDAQAKFDGFIDSLVNVTSA